MREAFIAFADVNQADQVDAAQCYQDARCAKERDRIQPERALRGDYSGRELHFLADHHIFLCHGLTQSEGRVQVEQDIEEDQHTYDH